MPDALQGSAETALAETRQGVGGGPEQVGVAEDELWLAVLLPAVVGEGLVTVFGGVGVQHAVFGEEEVEDHLGVQGPVVWVGIDEDGVDF